MGHTKIWKSVFFSAYLHASMELELARNWDRIHTSYKALLDSLVETSSSLGKTSQDLFSEWVCSGNSKKKHVGRKIENIGI